MWATHKLSKQPWVSEWMKSLSRVLTPCNPMDCSLSRSSIHGILQARVLEWVAISFSRGSSWPRDQTRVSHIVGRRFTEAYHQGSPYGFQNSLTNYNLLFFTIEENKAQGGEASCPGSWNQGLSDTINKMYASFTLNILYPGSMRWGNADTFLWTH